MHCEQIFILACASKEGCEELKYKNGKPNWVDLWHSFSQMFSWLHEIHSNKLFGPSADPNRISTQECSRYSASGQTFLRTTWAKYVKSDTIQSDTSHIGKVNWTWHVTGVHTSCNSSTPPLALYIAFWLNSRPNIRFADYDNFMELRCW